MASIVLVIWFVSLAFAYEIGVFIGSNSEPQAKVMTCK